MSERLAYQYVVLRCVPRVERGELVNVGVVLACQERDFLRAAWQADPERLLALDPRLDVDRLRESLRFVVAVCDGDAERGGAAAGTPLSQRFGFLSAPRSTLLQPGPVHGGLTTDPARQLDHLLHRLVG